jgi:hypothetical protein
MRLLYYGMFDQPSDCENWICDSLTSEDVLVHRWDRGFRPLNGLADINLFIEYLIKAGIQVVLISKAVEFNARVIEEIRRRTTCKIVWWTFDYMAEPHNWNWFGPAAQRSDICFMTDGTDADGFYSRAGLNRVELHQAAYDRMHFPLSSCYPEFDSDVAFLGSLYTPERRELHEFLSKGSWTYRQFGGQGFERGVWGRDFRKVIWKTKIIVSNNFRNDIHGYWSDRIYLTLGCGGFFLTKYVPGLEKEFEFDKEIVVWRNLNELEEKIKYYQEHEAERRKIAEAGHEKVKANHYYRHRVSQFIEKVEGLL